MKIEVILLSIKMIMKNLFLNYNIKNDDLNQFLLLLYMDKVQLNLYSAKEQNISIHPKELWDLYTPKTRASVNWFYDLHPYKFNITFPEIECVLFNYVDRGIKSWAEFYKALKTWFPSLKTLLLAENYSCSSELEFKDFLENPWLAHIWIEDYQSKYKCIYDTLNIPDNKMRVFDTCLYYIDIENKTTYIDEYTEKIKEIGISPFSIKEKNKECIIILAEELQDKIL